MKRFVVALLCAGLVFCKSSAAFAEDFYQGDYEDSALLRYPWKYPKMMLKKASRGNK